MVLEDYMVGKKAPGDTGGFQNLEGVEKSSFKQLEITACRVSMQDIQASGGRVQSVSVYPALIILIQQI